MSSKVIKLFSHGGKYLLFDWKSFAFVWNSKLAKPMELLKLTTPESQPSTLNRCEEAHC